MTGPCSEAISLGLDNFAALVDSQGETWNMFWLHFRRDISIDVIALLSGSRRSCVAGHRKTRRREQKHSDPFNFVTHDFQS